MEKKARVQALIASKKNGFIVAQESVLLSMTDDQIKALEDADAAQTDPPPPAQTPPVSSTPSVPAKKEDDNKEDDEDKDKKEKKTLTEAEEEEEYLKKAPRSLQNLMKSYKSSELVRRTTLVGRLKNAQKTYSEQDLNDLPIDQLEKIATLAGVSSPEQVDRGPVDFSLRGMPRAASENDAIEAPERLSDRIRTSAGKK